MKLAAFSTILAFTLTPFTLAETYRTEISASYGEVDSDYYPNDNYSINLQGKQYFSPVDTTNLPLAEAAFLQKASSFSLLLANYNYESSYLDGDDYVRGASATYFIPNSLFFVGAGITQSKSTYDYHYYFNDDEYEGSVSSNWDSRWTATLGIAPIEGLQVWSGFTEDVDVSDYWNLSAKYVKPLAGERAFGIETHYSDDRLFDLRSITVSADYYFNHRFSVGAGLTDYSDGNDNNSYHLRARHFLTENTSLEVGYFSADYSKSWKLGGTVRF